MIQATTTKKALWSCQMTASEADTQEDVDVLVEDAVARGVPTPNYDAASEIPDHSADDLAEALAQDYQAAGFVVDFDDGECITVYEDETPPSPSATRAPHTRHLASDTEAQDATTVQVPVHEGTKRPLRLTFKASRAEALADFVEHDPGGPQCRMSLYRSRRRDTWQVGLHEAVDQAMIDYGEETDRVFYPTQAGALHPESVLHPEAAVCTLNPAPPLEQPWRD